MTDQKPIEYDPKIAQVVTGAMERAAKEVGNHVPVAFEELTAEPGDMPRLMLKPTASDAVERRYVSGEVLRAFPFSATLRIAAESEQDRLDAASWLQRLAEAFEEGEMAVPGAAVYSKLQRTVPTCLGRTERFEDWQVTFEVKYKTTARR